jgi:4,5-dihydroxyphthalate decarboxylase
MAALRTGDVTVEGVDLNYIAIDSPREIFDRMGGRQEFDVAEFSSSEFIGRFARGDCPFVALPVFPSRVFRHGYIYVNRRSGIKVPKHLEHRRVGIALYTQTAAVWIRGHLAHQYGVDLSTIHWVEGVVEKGGPHGSPNAPPLLKPAAIERNRSGRSLSELLAAGEIDALAAARHPRPHPDVMPLFADAKAVECAFYEDTRIFPIMHLVAIRRDRYERDPWIASSLYKAFVEAKNRGLIAPARRPRLYAALDSSGREGNWRGVRRRPLALRHRSQSPHPGGAGPIHGGTGSYWASARGRGPIRSRSARRPRRVRCRGRALAVARCHSRSLHTRQGYLWLERTSTATLQ